MSARIGLKIRVVASVFMIAVASTTSAGEIIDADNDGNYDDVSSHLIEKLSVVPLVEYAPNEIIVKFHEAAAAIVQEQLEHQGAVGEFILSQDLDKLNARYKVREIKPIFKDFRQRRERLKALNGKRKELLTQKEKRLLTRLERAPKDASVPDLDRIYKIQIDLEPDQSLEEVVAAYNNNPDVEYAEFNYIVSIFKSPDDPLYPLQWSLNNTGQDYPESGDYNPPPGTPDCDIDAPEAWDIHTGSSEVVIAVIDTGVDYNHRDLRDNMWVNVAELNGLDWVDDDGNGYVDDIYGYDFVNNDRDPIDDHGHGTHCSGTIAAEGDNGLDIPGVCWRARIMALKFLDSGGHGDTEDAVAAFYYAVTNGADVTSNSWGGGDYSETMEEAINYAQSQGVIMIAAAGNDNSNLPHYPAAYENMIAVAATDSNDGKASFSNYGDWVDIAAPGVDILSLRGSGTSMGTAYDVYTTIASGTSMACPHIAGGCAIMLSANPFLTNEQVYDILMEAVDPIAPGVCRSGGRLNILSVVQSAVAPQGRVHLKHDYYSCSDEVVIWLADSDLAGGGSQIVSLATMEGDGESALLTETTTANGIFTGSIFTGLGDPNTEDGILQLSHGEVITVTYLDADDGTGHPATVEDTAIADCEAPEIFNVGSIAHGVGAQVTFDTDEPTTARVLCGEVCGGPYIFEKHDGTLATTHTIILTDLQVETDYYFIIEATDTAGNVTVDDNNGLCYSFTTGSSVVLHVPSEYPTIQSAIDEAWGWAGATVLVADGTYTGPGNRDIDFGGKAVTVRSENGPEHCIIDCEGTTTEPHRGFYFHSSEGENSIVEGFTITNGYGTEKFVIDYMEIIGGAIFCKDSNPTIINCIITNNYATNYGAMYNENSSPTVINCRFEWTRPGSGMGNVDSNPTVIGCMFRDNKESGMYNENSNSTLTNCAFISNQYWGMYSINGETMLTDCTFRSNFDGGMYNYKSMMLLTNCEFIGNSGKKGGGMWHRGQDTGSTKLINCVFVGNSVTRYGGGIYIYEGSSPILINCTFGRNTAGEDGGGIYSSGGTPMVTNCILWENTDSGGMDESAQIHGGTPDINYSCIQGWTGSLGGTGNIGDDPLFVDIDGSDNVLSTEDDNPRLLAGSACLDAGDNSAIPPSVPTDLDGNPRIVNGTADMGAYEGANQGFLLNTQSVTIAEGTTAGFTVALAMAPLETVEVSVANEWGDPDITVQSGGALTFDLSNYSEPQMVTLAAAEGADNLDGIALIQVSTPGIFTAGVTVTEVDNDMPHSEILYVDAQGPGVNNGSSWAESYTELQDAMRIATIYSWIKEIRVAQGVYRPGGPGSDRAVTFQLLDDLTLKGGYPGYGAADPNVRDVELYETILSGDLNGDDTEIGDAKDLLDEPSRFENSYHVVTGSGTGPSTVLDGFTIAAGNADGSEDHLFGGGMYNYQSSPTVTGCAFTGNSAGWGGGGMFNDGSNPILNNCRFIGNATSSGGGGMRNKESSPVVTNCTFSSNSADNGGGMYIGLHSNPILTNCVFSGNSAWSEFHGGGGMYNYSSSATLINCVFTGNSAIIIAGGIYSSGHNAHMILSNCTFSGNSAGRGGGIRCSYGNMALTNCILWGNSDDGGMDESAQIHPLHMTPEIKYSCIQGLDSFAGGGNIDVDPLFVDADGADNTAGTEDDNLRLSPNSPCVDTGNNNALPADTADLDNDGNTTEPIPYNLDGRPRIMDGDCNGTFIVDMGAYEFDFSFLGDCSGDCFINLVDYAIFAEHYLESGCSEENNWCHRADIDRKNGVVLEDLFIMAANWLAGIE